MDGYGKRVLVVDNNPDRQARLEAQLEQEGYTVQTAFDGVAGAHEMRKRHVEAVIADGRLPAFTVLPAPRGLFNESGDSELPQQPRGLLIESGLGGLVLSVPR